MMQLPLSLHTCFRDCWVASCSGPQPCGQDVAEAPARYSVPRPLAGAAAGPTNLRRCVRCFIIQQAASSRHLV